MNSAPQPIREWHDVGVQTFRTVIVPQEQPAVLRGLVRDWPAVRRGLQSATDLAEYIKWRDSGKPVDVFAGDPAIRGRFFYQDDLAGVNFERRKESLSALIDRLLEIMPTLEPPSMYAGSVIIPEVLPTFEVENPLPFVNAPPRIWIGNAITVSTHYDLSANLACVVAGRRRFTLFPPQQLANMYVGPLDFTLAGQPVSMVDPEAPDLERYPRFEQALRTAQAAELQPGDAIYIPHMWWHHVKSLDPFNVLVNYWWEDAPAYAGSPFEALVHGLLAIRHLPPEHRDVWRTIFDYYIFQTGPDPTEHLPPQQRGVLGPLTPELARRIRMFLMHGLSRRQ